MAAEQLTADLLAFDVMSEVEKHLDSEELAARRADVIQNVVGCLALRGADLPHTLDVPNIVTYERLEELVSPSPEENVWLVYRPYINEQKKILTDVLGGLDPISEIDTLVDTTTEALIREADRRIDGLAEVVEALGKPSQHLFDVIDERMHEREYIRHYVAVGEIDPNQPPEALLGNILSRGMLMARFHINIERDVTEKVIDGESVAEFLPPGSDETTSRLRKWFQQKIHFKSSTSN